MSTPSPVVLRWDGADWEPVAPGPVDVIDSFRLRDGRVVRLDLHEARFAGSCAGRVPLADVARFLDAVRRVLPRDGDWFPRLELAGDELRLALRPCPPLTTAARLLPVRDVVPQCPTVKGADLAAYTAAKARAVAAGADEALLLDPSGRVLEGATTSLLWWRDDVLHTVATLDVLDGVTARVVTGLAGGVRRVDAGLDDLVGCEVWAVNALHGIRAVPEIVGGPALGPASRLASWAARYRALATPLP